MPLYQVLEAHECDGQKVLEAPWARHRGTHVSMSVSMWVRILGWKSTSALYFTVEEVESQRGSSLSLPLR